MKIVAIFALAAAFRVIPSDAQRGEQYQRGLKRNGGRGGGQGMFEGGFGNSKGYGMLGGMYGGELFNTLNFTTIDCAEPQLCGLRGNETGILVCRTFKERYSLHMFALCADEEKGLDGDDCGCCDEACPTECTTPCENEEGLVLMAYDEYPEKTRCVSPLDSVTNQLRGRLVCV